MSGVVVTSFLRITVGQVAALKRRHLLFAATYDEVPTR
jgi:hypothetical protein